MTRIAALTIAVTLLVIATTPTLAAAANDGFYPGDAPPSADQAGHHDETSPSCDTNRVCEDGDYHPANPRAFVAGAKK